MPEIMEGETRDEFMGRCIPKVLDDGTAGDQNQAVAVCANMWSEREKSLAMSFKPDHYGEDAGSSSESPTTREEFMEECDGTEEECEEAWMERSKSGPRKFDWLSLLN